MHTFFFSTALFCAFRLLASLLAFFCFIFRCHVHTSICNSATFVTSAMNVKVQQDKSIILRETCIEAWHISAHIIGLSYFSFLPRWAYFMFSIIRLFQLFNDASQGADVDDDIRRRLINTRQFLAYLQSFHVCFSSV
jgi:hypothetical protein